MKIAIVGSRDFTRLDLVRQFVQELSPDTTVISGGARGVDSVAVDEAKRLNMPCEVYRADWDQYGRSAGYKRNVILVEKADKIVAFWDGKSKGTSHTIDLAKKADKPITIIQG